MISARLALFTLLCVLPVSAYPWADEGHHAIWELAQSLLTPQARQKVDAALAGDRLDMTAVWLDRVRDVGKNEGPLVGDAAAAEFIKSFPFHFTWHYVDMPLDVKSYAEAKDFTTRDDIVQQINLCIECLEEKSTKLDKRAALRVLVHLIGDIHQPMHCASGFFDVSDPQKPQLRTDPASCLPLKKEKLEDRGANQLFFGPEKYDQMHALWDFELVKRLAGLKNLAKLLKEALPKIDTTTPGDHHAWAEHWAGESVALARNAYAGIEFGACTLNTTGKGPKIERIEVKLPADYIDKQKVVAGTQLVKAAARTAAVLNAIWP